MSLREKIEFYREHPITGGELSLLAVSGVSALLSLTTDAESHPALVLIMSLISSVTIIAHVTIMHRRFKAWQQNRKQR